MTTKRFLVLLPIALLCTCLAAGFAGQAVAWSNGGYSGDPQHPDYGTHDWVAQHALDWLPPSEKQFFTDHLTSYLYGTELPDNPGTPDGVGDTTKHHIYFYANGSVQDDASAVRASAEYLAAQNAYLAGNFSAAAEHLGMVTHYISDMAVFGHVMGASTPWGAETHHSDYEDYVLARTRNYSGGDFDMYLAFDGNLSSTSTYDATVAVANLTTFDSGYPLNCTWMDQNYNWSNFVFKSRCGESLNSAVNAVADVLHTFFQQTVVPEFPLAGMVLALCLTVSSALVVLLGKKAFLRKGI